MKASEMRDLIDKRIAEHGDFDIRFDNCNVKDIRFIHEYFTNMWFEIMT